MAKMYHCPDDENQQSKIQNSKFLFLLLLIVVVIGIIVAIRLQSPLYGIFPFFASVFAAFRLVDRNSKIKGAMRYSEKLRELPDDYTVLYDIADRLAVKKRKSKISTVVVGPSGIFYLASLIESGTLYVVDQLEEETVFDGENTTDYYYDATMLVAREAEALTKLLYTNRVYQLVVGVIWWQSRNDNFLTVNSTKIPVVIEKKTTNAIYEYIVGYDLKRKKLTQLQIEEIVLLIIK
jgi:hypothetical protein